MRRTSIMIGSSLLLAGCHASVSVAPNTHTVTRTETVETVHPTDSAQFDQAQLDRLAGRVRDAADPVEEGTALRHLHQYAADHNLIYTLSAYRISDGARVPTPSSHTEMLRVDLSFFRGNQPLETIAFNPKDNRNLAILGLDN